MKTCTAVTDKRWTTGEATFLLITTLVEKTSFYIPTLWLTSRDHAEGATRLIQERGAVAWTLRDFTNRRFTNNRLYFHR